MEHVVSSSSSTPESSLSLLLSSPFASFTGLNDDVGAAPPVDDGDPTISFLSSDNSLFDEDSQRVVNIGDVANVIRRVFNTCAISFVGGDDSQFAVTAVDELDTTTAAADTVNAVAAAAVISDDIIIDVGPVVWP
jgi:hypothetical protein